MTQSILNKYPVARGCCFNTYSPKVGTIVVAVVGSILSLLLVLFFNDLKFYLLEYGMSPILAEIVVHVYATFGIILFMTHVKLIFAALSYNETIVLMYLWVVLVYVCTDVLLSIIIVISLLISRFILQAVVFFVFQMFYWCIFIVFVLPVVNGFRRSIHTVTIKL